MAICQTIEIFEKICSLRTLIYFGKTMILLGEKNYDTVPETMELWFTMEKNGTKEKTIQL